MNSNGPSHIHVSSPLRADLHLHSTQSDGRFAAVKVVEMAVEKGLQIVSITDHDTVAGVPAARQRARELGCMFVDGLELEATLEESPDEHDPIHILGYGIDITHPSLLGILQQIRDNRVLRTEEICRQLTVMGYPIEFDRVLERSTGQSVSRVHIAQVMKENGYVGSIDEAFLRLIGDDKPAYVPREGPGPEQLIDLIHAAGGIAVWAHPYYSGRDDLLEPLLDAGLDGIECYHSQFDAETAQHYLSMAEEHDLIVTGGSDFHGTLEENFELGDWWFNLQRLPIPPSVAPKDVTSFKAS